jgi:hypothetical protein
MNPTVPGPLVAPDVLAPVTNPGIGHEWRNDCVT